MIAVGAVVIAVAASSATVQPTQAESAALTATVIRWSDGDTVVTSAGTVRLIGINAPDRKACGFKAAKSSAKNWPRSDRPSR